MHQSQLPTTDAAIVGRLGKPDHSDFSPEAAREILSIQLSGEDQTHMQGAFPQSSKGNPLADGAKRGGKLSAGRILAWHSLV